MKLLIAEACLVVLLGAEITSHADVGDTVDVSKDDANQLTRSGRAMFLEKADDPTKGQLTAGADDKDRIAKQAKAIAASQKQLAAATQPTDFASMLQAGIAAGIAEGIKAIQASQAQPAAGGVKT